MRHSEWPKKKGDAGRVATIVLTRRGAILAMSAAFLSKAGASGSLAQSSEADSVTEVAANAGPKSVRVVTAKGAGDEDGRDWDNAMPIGALANALSNASPGVAFRIGFDRAGAETVALDTAQIYVKTSGGKDNPILIEAGILAADTAIEAPARDAPPFFKNTRGWSLDRFGKRGNPPCYFAIAKGASHLRFAGFRLEGTPADGFIKFRAKKDRPEKFDDIVISGIEARNVGRIIETDRGAALENVVIEDCRAFGIVRGFARFRRLSDSVLRNLHLDAEHLDAGGKNICQLLSLEAGDNVRFEDIVLRDAVNLPSKKEGREQGYVQGDGIVCERKTRNITIRRCQASGMGDGAFDLKSTDVLIEDSSAEGCKFGARIWSEGNNVIRRCTFRNPQSRGGVKGACIQASGTLEIVDTVLQAGAGTAAIALHKLKSQRDPVVRMTGGSIQLDGDAVVAASNGFGGVLELHNVVVNGVATNHRYVFEQKKQ